MHHHEQTTTHSQGLSNFHSGQAFLGGFSSFAQTFVWAFYSYGGVELVTLAAGETAKPHKAIPRAIKATFFRIVLFYVLTMLTIGLCINNADPTLLNAANGTCVVGGFSFLFLFFCLVAGLMGTGSTFFLCLLAVSFFGRGCGFSVGLA